MKKKFLTVLGGALLGLFSMNVTAQNWVDVTDTYLSNADFSSGDAISLHLCGYQGDITKAENKYNGNNALYWAQDVTGWTVSSTKADGSAGALFAYGSDQQMKGNSKSAPATNPDNEASGNALGIFATWTGTIQYTQEVTLPAGHYKFQYTYYNQSGTGTITNYCGFVPNSGTASYAANATFTTGSWKTVDVEFTLGQETAGKISLGFKAPNSSSSSCPMLFIDNVKLQFDNTVDKTNLSALITTAEGLYSVSGNEAAAFKTAIDAAKAVNTDTAATIADVLGAETALQTAIDAYKLANASASNPVDFTTQIGNIAGSTAGWTFTTGARNRDYKTSTEKNTSEYVASGFIENWNSSAFTGKISYTITGLPAGSYRVSALAFDNVKSGNVYFFAGNKEVALDNTTDKFSNPVITGAVVEENAGLEVGLNIKSSASNWVGIANIKVEYIGYDATAALEALAETVNAATYSDKHSAKSEEDLQTAIAAANVLINAGTATKDAIATATTNLSSAIAAVEASITDYAALQVAIDAASYSVITPSYTALATAKTTAQGIYVAATAESCTEAIAALNAAVNAAKVADYSYVMGYFTEDASLGAWTNTYDTNKKTDEGYDTSTGYYDLWSANATPAISQTVTLPAGEYALIGIGRGQEEKSTEKLSVKIGDGEATTVDFLMKGNTGLGVNTSGEADFTEGNGHSYTRDGAGQGWEYRFILFTLTEESSVTLGANATLSGSWAGVYPLQVKTTAASIKALKITEINALAASAPTDKMQASVKSTLDEKLDAAAAASTDNTKEELQAIYDALKDAVDAANASVANYKALNSVIATSNACYNENAEGAADFNDAIETAEAAYEDAETDATSEIAAIKSALKTYVEANAINMVVNGTFDTNTDGWSSTTGAPNQGLASNKAGDFTDKFWENWNGTPKTGKMSQKNADVLPAGDYVLQIAAFGDQVPAYEGSNLYVFVDDQKAAVISDVPTYYYVPFTLTEAAAAGTVEYGLVAESGNKSGWIGIDNVSISYVSGKGNFLATETEYAALNEAITAAEAKTLGFEVGEYAPYNNIAAIQALAAAKAIDQEADNSKDAVEAATTALTGTTWTANTEEVNAVYDGSFNLTTKAQGDYIVPTGWTNVGYNTRVYNSSNMGSNTGVDATSKTATMFAKFTTEYGTEAGYTMPLKAGVYYLSFIYGGWNEIGTREIKVYKADDNATSATVTPSSVTAKDNKAHTNVAASWSTYSGLIEIPADGDYILSFYRENTSNQNQICISDIELKKAASANMAITAVKWGTFVAPFDVTIPEGVEAYTCDAVEGDVITTTEVETTIPANTPVLVYSESEVNETFYGKAVSGNPTTDYLVGIYEPTKAPAGSYILMLHNDKAVFGKVVADDEPTVGANRCYLNVPGGTSSTMLRFGDVTGIQSMEQQGESVIYDLTGRRVDAAVKGIYIVNGKKMLVK